MEFYWECSIYYRVWREVYYLDHAVHYHSEVLLLYQWLCPRKSYTIKRNQAGWSYFSIHLHPLQQSSVKIMLSGSTKWKSTCVKVATKIPRINHLLFADDTMFFIRSDSMSISTLMEILRQYENASGQMISPEKSPIFFSARTDTATRERVKQTLGISKEGGVGKYLGLRKHFRHKKRDLFTSIVDKIIVRAVNWSTKQLSTAGKMTTIQAVLSAIPAFAMTCFQLPVSLCKRKQ